MTGRVGQAVRAFSFGGCAAVVVLLAACSQNDPSEQSEVAPEGPATRPAIAATGYASSYQKEFVKSFVQSCEASAARSGAPKELLTRLCRCGADKALKQFDESEMMSLTPADMAPIMQACVEENGGRGA